ncbi:MAG: porin family protein [Gemmatimonadota bacterium]|nr:porin family protein [Gemmatimonadota bacterium]
MQAHVVHSRLSSVVLTAGLIALPALAGPAEPGGEIGFDLGRLNFASEVSSDDATSFGLRGGYHFNKLFLLEGQLASASADDFAGDATLNTLFVNGVFNFNLRPRVRPYVMAGVGQANLEFKLGGFKVDDTDVAYQVGAGSRFLIGNTQRMLARLEVTRMRETTFNESSNYTSVTTGLSWRLGRRS